MPRSGTRSGLWAIITGTAGWGKSRLIHALRSSLGTKCRVAAYTGTAAFLVYGYILHTLLHLQTSKSLEDLGSPQDDVPASKRCKLQAELSGVTTIIIDEYSMISLKMLAVIEKYLRAAFPDSQDFFGNCNIIIFGDIAQLPPVSGSRCVIAKAAYRSPTVSRGYSIFHSFRTVFELLQVFRIQENDPSSAVFKELLHRMRLLSPNHDDYITYQPWFLHCRLKKANRRLIL